MSKQSNVVLGILGAVVAGVAIGILIAPDKGSEMRKKLKKTTGDWADSLGQIFNKTKEEVEDLASNLKRNKEMPTGS
jgi:gas vesicle protein